MIKKSLSEWRKLLTPEQFRILRENGTEAPFTKNSYWNFSKDGEYRCVGCNSLLFRSDDKFTSQCGWPAFSQPANKETIILREDLSAGMHRIEVRCGNCDGHLGHVFDDGPAPLNTRYCINGTCLKYNPTDKCESESK
jgi:peptide-methionine (R)-S-oxide reductase